MELVTSTLYCFITLFIILDPFLGLALFITLTKHMKRKERYKQAFIACFVAFALLMIFLFTGQWILELLGISFSSFMIAGGIILLVMGIMSIIGIEFKRKKSMSAAAILIATPVLTGPGAMTTVVILSRQYGFIPPVIASVLVLGITWIMLINAEKIQKLLGERVIEILSRLMGLILAALAAEFIKNGIIDSLRDFFSGR